MTKYTIYKIICKDENITDCYVGSTKDFDRRKIQHKSCCNNESLFNYNYKIYNFIRNNGGFDNFNFEVIEILNCENKHKALNRERYWIENLKSNLNTCKPTLDFEKRYKYRQKWEDNNKEYYKEYHKEYYENNKDYILKRTKEYGSQIINCECGNILKRHSFTKHEKTAKHLSYLNQKQTEMGHTLEHQQVV